MEYNKESVSGKYIEDRSVFSCISMPGDWTFVEDEYGKVTDIRIFIPGRGGVNWNLEPEFGPPCWKWDGNRESPSIKPSLHLVGYWHGWMTAGELRSV